VKSATDTVDFAVTELGNGLSALEKLVVIEGSGNLIRETKDVSVSFHKIGSGVGVSSHHEQCQWGLVDAN
jgi:hypothetical protein